jgi:hypothetical protein
MYVEYFLSGFQFHFVSLKNSRSKNCYSILHPVYNLLFLVPAIFNYCCNLRLADRYCAVIVLPLKLLFYGFPNRKIPLLLIVPS